MVKKYKTKPCEIEAIQWTGSNLKEVLEFANNKIIYDEITVQGSGELLGYEISIETLEGIMLASKGDYIIKGLRGEFYPCKPDVFEKKYEIIDNNIKTFEEQILEKINKIHSRQETIRKNMG